MGWRSIARRSGPGGALAGTGRILDAVNVGDREMTVSSFPGLALERRDVAVYRSCQLAEERCW